MASVFKETHMKDYLLMQHVIFKYHPLYMNEDDKLKNKILTHALHGHMNVEHIVEDLISICGGIERTNLKGMDYTDLSDSKVVSITSPWPNRPYLKRWTVNGIQNKVGWLRTIIYKGSDFEEPFAFFNIPIHKNDKEISLKQSKNKDKISIFGVYRQEFDSFDDIEEFRVPTFYGICQSVADLEKKYQPSTNNVYDFM